MTGNKLAMSIMVIAIITMSVVNSSNRSSVVRCSANSNIGAASSSASTGNGSEISIECSVNDGVNITVAGSNVG